MRHVTTLRTMRRLWCDASVVVSGLELSLERGRQAASNRETKRKRRKEGSAGAPTRGEEAGAARGRLKFQARRLASIEPPAGALAPAAATPRS